MAATEALPALHAAQAEASAPDRHVWLSASAGTGKTQVLAARVFRLLLAGVDPGAILCLTFTKAGAAEMAGRINDRLARWVRMPGPALTGDLNALGEHSTPELQAHARTLFAKVLDAPGGGVRIGTIHSFCGTLLSAFPLEAGLNPGFRPLDKREEGRLARETLAALLVQAEREGRSAPEEAIGALSERMGEEGAEHYFYDCARSLEGLDALPVVIGPWLRRALDLPQGSAEEVLAEGCGAIQSDGLIRLAAANRAWNTQTGHKQADILERWMAAATPSRAETLGALLSTVYTDKGVARRDNARLAKHDADFEALAEAVGTHCAEFLSTATRIAYADLLAGALTVGRDYARAYANAKRRAGAVDFDDLIANTLALLMQPGIGEWVRYKLDQATEHVLIDEAQDTNASQWGIVRALVEEFFAGRGTRPSGSTLFTVGDYKQAIFGFQGTNPDTFVIAKDWFADKAADARGDDDWPDNERGLPMVQLGLHQSFRSTRPILRFVDAMLATIDEPGMGAVGSLDPHASEVAGPGTVELWPPVGDSSDGGDEEDWVEGAVRGLAKAIARQVKTWLADPPILAKSGKPLQPQDIMILVQRRGELASLLVARLYAEGVPVAGIDRLRLNAPLAVQDLLAAVRFVLQPEDDLSLAALLVSPLIGWTQDDLMHAAPRGRLSLWAHLRATQPEARLEPLRAMLARADFTTPYQFFEELLSGPLDARRKMLLRLGAEARDHIEELLSAALAFETTTTPSLQRFLDWFDRGDVEIVRDPSMPLDAVRVMTVHGAKGLQAPVVILADACVDPTTAPRRSIRWEYDPDQPPIPVFRPRAFERGGPLDAVLDEAAVRDLQEHWRLLYVAATRAEEHLVIAGSLSKSKKGAAPGKSWYAVAARALTELGVPEIDGTGEAPRVYRDPGKPFGPPRSREAPKPPAPVPPLPAWARLPAPVEARPPRPLAPSSLRDDTTSQPPPTPAMRAAAERGRLIHALFERLPATPPPARAAAADRWLATAAGVADAAERAELIATVLGILDDPAYAPLFSGDALTEAPFTATLPNGLVIAGTVDRLLVEPDRVRLIDYKTGRVPAGVDAIPSYHLRQMAAYAEALTIIFPRRMIEAALLYTAGPSLLVPTSAMLEAHRPGRVEGGAAAP